MNLRLFRFYLLALITIAFSITVVLLAIASYSAVIGTHSQETQLRASASARITYLSQQNLLLQQRNTELERLDAICTAGQ